MTKEKAISILREQYARYHESSEVSLDKALEQAIIELEGPRCDWCGGPLGEEACSTPDGGVHRYCCCSCENYGADRRRIEALEKWRESVDKVVVVQFQE